MKKLLTGLKKYKPSNDYKIDARKEVLKNAKDLLETRNKITNAFRDGIVHYLKMCKKKDQRSKSWLDA